MTRSYGFPDALSFRPGGSTDPASEAFDVFSDWLAERLAVETARTPVPLFGEPRRTPIDGFVRPPMNGEDEPETRPCLHCGAETRNPVLCRSCLEERTELPEDADCPLYLSVAWCMAEMDRTGGLAATGCGGSLRECQHPEALEAGGEAAGRRRSENGDGGLPTRGAAAKGVTP